RLYMLVFHLQSLFPSFFRSCPPRFPFFFNASASTALYTLSLHDALPIYLMPIFRSLRWVAASSRIFGMSSRRNTLPMMPLRRIRSEEHTSELQSRENLVCRLLLEKKKNN